VPQSLLGLSVGNSEVLCFIRVLVGISNFPKLLFLDLTFLLSYLCIFLAKELAEAVCQHFVEFVLVVNKLLDVNLLSKMLVKVALDQSNL